MNSNASNGTTRVIVIGGGYAGVMAANRLNKRDDVSVTLVNSRPVFVERIRLHQFVGGSDDAVVNFEDVLASNVQLVVDSVSRIDAPRRSVTLDSGDILGYDYLIYAAGSMNAEWRVPGSETHALPIATMEEAERLRQVVDAAPPAAMLTVVGAGPAGIETAAELAELGRSVTLVTGGELGPYLHPKGRRSVAKRLERLGVAIVDGPGARVTEVRRDSVVLGDGRKLHSDVTIWTAGFRSPDLAHRSGLRTDAAGRLLTDESLTSVDDDRIVAAGDAASPSGLPFRMSCQAAGPLGAHAADTVLNRIAGKPVSPIALGFVGQCISLGRGAGIFQFSHRNDLAMPVFVSGRAGAKLKAVVCWGTVKQMTTEARKPGSYRWSWAADRSRQQKVQMLQGNVPNLVEPAS